MSWPKLAPMPYLRLLTLVTATVLLAACADTVTGPSLDGATTADGKALSRASGLVRLGDNALRAGEAETAARLFEQALVASPSNAGAAVGLGSSLLVAGRYQDAGRAFEMAFGDGDYGTAAQYGYARAMLGLRRPEAAIPHLESALQADPEDLKALNALAVAYDLTGQSDQAAATYRRGLELAPDDPALLNNLGLSQALAGRQDEALRTLQPLAEGPVSTRRSRQNLALAYGLKGDLASAERLSRVDLADDEVRNNLSYFTALRGMPSRHAAAALMPRVDAQGALERSASSARAQTRASRTEPAAPAASAGPRPIVAPPADALP
ncbi:MAG: tetratricopeptide repeat protein [Geminicoccaceae bacterium]